MGDPKHRPRVLTVGTELGCPWTAIRGYLRAFASAFTLVGAGGMWSCVGGDLAAGGWEKEAAKTSLTA
jgi:hypothetical protein